MMSVGGNDVANDVVYGVDGVGNGVGNGVGTAAKMVSHGATPFLTSFVQKTLILFCQ